jgi:beta-1,4-mannosyl-glycoprotein beta-1,4-N-acetylglucosaminyltransferase
MLIDVVLLFDELDLYELRLRVLDGLVDHFIVIQSTETFSGLQKPLYFDSQGARWAPWQGRIRSVVVPRLATLDRWKRERLARRAVMSAVAGYADRDVVLVSDCDEIPDPVMVRQTVPQLDDVRWARFWVTSYYYYLNLRTPGKRTYTSTLSRVSVLRHYGAPALRNRRVRAPIICKGGWHFSWIGGVAAIQAKLMAFSHAELGMEPYTNASHIADCLQRRRWLGPDSTDYFEVAPLSELPDEVQQNPERYQALLWGHESAGTPEAFYVKSQMAAVTASYEVKERIKGDVLHG